MVRRNGNNSDAITTWLIRSGVGLACFLAHEQLAEIKSFIIEVRSESKITISAIATLQEKVSNIEQGIRQRAVPRP